MSVERWKKVLLISNIATIVIGLITAYLCFTTRGLDQIWEHIPIETKLSNQFKVVFNDHGTSIILCLTLTIQGVCGCYVSHYAEHENMMSIYWALQLFSFSEQMIFYYFLVSFLYEREKITKEGLQELLFMYSSHNKNNDKNYIDMIQIQLNCCGIEDNKIEWIQHVGHIPGSCCAEKQQKVSSSCTDKDVEQKQSCLYPATDSFQAYLIVRMVIAWIVLIILLINLTAYSVVEADVKRKAAKIKPPPIIEEPIDRNIDSNS